MPPKKRRNSDPEGLLHKLQLSSELTNAKRLKIESIQPQNEKYDKIAKIVQREFDMEVKNKEKELEIVNERLNQARMIMDHLRYAIVQKYYKEQELKVTDAEAALIRGQKLFEYEDKGPQMPLHPSVRKLVGKKPKSLSDLLRATPQRAAAQTAKTTISQRINPKNSTKESCLMRKIRKEGVVIDHSKLGEAASIDSKEVISSAIKLEQEFSQPIPLDSTTTTQSLNASRLNNKIKHLLVIGNTSKYIGGEIENERGDGNKYSHKWLVYVQYKDPKVHISNFVKMVRFHLHPSYRPNDVVDVSTPPFQICRHGWGEFPMRVQIFFQDSFNEKPLQLVHNLVLDKLHTGLQTMGAETMVEIWLRGQTDSKANESSAIDDTLPLLENKSKPRTISYTQNKEDLEDNLFDFLKNIGEMPANICADIDKIEPTVLVTEPLDGFKVETSPKKIPTTTQANSGMNELSPIKIISQSMSPKKVKNGNLLEKSKEVSTVAMNKSTTSLDAPVVISSAPTSEKDFVTTSATVTSAPNTCGTTAVGTSVPQLNKPKSEVKRNIVFNKVERMILPIVKNDNTSIKNVQTTIATSSATSGDKLVNLNLGPKKLLQKKLVPVMDSSGKVKYLQMLVAVTVGSIQTISKPIIISATTTTTAVNGQGQKLTTTTTDSVKTITNPRVIKQIPLSIDINKSNATLSAETILQKSNLETTEAIPIDPKLISTNNQKKVVFQKEGKLYIIDPLQKKLRVQQKQQVSLLKPQVSLLKQQINQTAKSIVSDHDYTPSKSETNIKPSTMPKKIPIIESYPSDQRTANHYPMHLGIRQTRANFYNLPDQLRMQRFAFEKKFHQQNFDNIRSAVEFLLRRLSLVTNTESINNFFPFMYESMKDFQALSAFKQRSCEWLRAKFILRCIRNHKSFKEDKNSHWTTREIVIFARTHAYTPKIKLLKPTTDCESAANDEKSSKLSTKFTDLVRKQLMSKEQTSLTTLTANNKISNWLDEMWKRLQQYEDLSNDREIIDVDTWEDDKRKKISKCTKLYQSNSVVKERTTNDIVYLKPPEALETEIDLLKDINKNLDIHLEAEEITPKVFLPSVETILAKCLQLFIGQLTHRSMAAKLEDSTGIKNQNGLVEIDSNETTTISNYDLGKAIMGTPEFDFLTQMQLGGIKQNIKTETNL